MIDQIEKQFGFHYPIIYLQLYADGMLDWSQEQDQSMTSAGSGYRDAFQQVKHNPPFLLINNDFHLWPLRQVEEYLQYTRTLKEPMHRLVPFGANRAGDLYAFYFNERRNDIVPIVLMSHDQNQAHFVAASLNDFIFRQLIEITHFPQQRTEIEEQQFRIAIFHQLQTHKKHLTAGKVRVIEHYYNQPIQKYAHRSVGSGEEFHDFGMLSHAELQQVLDRHIDFPLLGCAFSYRD